MQDLKLECLLSSARGLLLKLVESDYMKNFVLVGGSALALYLCHRFSEDLDFFTYNDSNFQREEIFRIIDKFESKEIMNISDEQIDAIIEGVKVTFFNAKWRFLRPKEIKNYTPP